MKTLPLIALLALGSLLAGGCGVSEKEPPVGKPPADNPTVDASNTTASATTATGGQDKDGRMLRLTAKAGDRYTMVTTVETVAELPGPDGKLQSGTMKLTTTEAHTCTKVEGTNMTWEAKNTDVQASGTGPFEAQAEMSKTQQKGKSETKVRDERNQVVGASEDEALALSYPERPVKVGDTWSSETKVMGAKVKIDFTLKKFETIDGKVAAVITALLAENERIRSDGPLSLYVNLANGWPIKGSGAFTMHPQPGVTALMKVKMDVK